MIRRPPRSTRVRSSAASDVYKRQVGVRHVSGRWCAQARPGRVSQVEPLPARRPVAYLLAVDAPIEALQIFVLRPATLALRLAANMIAGHLLLVLTFSATHYF